MRARNRGEWKLLVETVVKTGQVMKKGGKSDPPNPGQQETDRHTYVFTRPDYLLLNK